MRDTRRQNSIVAVFGVVMIVSMLAGSILPLIQANQQRAIVPTPTVVATLPAPIADLSSIQFNETYLHPSGLFTVGLPTGWVTERENTTAAEAQATMRNESALSVVELRVIDAGDGVTTAEQVSQYFSESWLRATWREYTAWDEATRNITADEVMIDFTLTRNQQTYIARQVGYTDGTWIYVIRAVAPENAPDLVKYLLENLKTSFKPNTQFASTPISWSGYFDSATKYFIRYPNTWQISDSGVGLPTTISADGVTLRVENVKTTLADAAAAQAWVEASRAGITVNNVSAIEQFGNQGFRVVYTLQTPDGEAENGVALLLNGADDNAYVANLRVNTPVDFTTATATDETLSFNARDGLNALNTFSIFAGLEIVTAAS